MKQIAEIYKQDWRNLFKVPVAIFLIVALIVLPSIYDWVNVAAVWDPYSNTSGIKIAVTSKDKGAEIEGESINIGKDVLESLKDNTKLGWTFVSEEQAREGVRHGDYYASLLIPEDFSQNITSILDGHIQRPEIIYTVNEKINAVAPKITEKGATSITAQISENFMETLSTTVFTRLKELDEAFEAELPAIRRVEKGILELEKSLPHLESIAAKVLELEKKLPELKEKSEKVAVLENRIPEINQAGEAVLKIEEQLPLVQEAVRVLTVFQGKLPEVQHISGRIMELDQRFGEVEQTVERAIAEIDKAQAVIHTALTALPTVERIAAEGGQFARELGQFMERNDAALDAIIPVIRQNLFLLQQTADSATQIARLLQDVDIDSSGLLKAMAFAGDRLETGSAIASRLAGMLSTLNHYLPGNVLGKQIEQLNDISSRFDQQRQQLARIIAAVERGEKPAKEPVDQLYRLSTSTSALLGGMIERFDTEAVPALQQAISRLKTIAADSTNALDLAAGKLPDIKELLDSTLKVADFGQMRLKELQDNLPQIRKIIHESAVNIDERLSGFTDAVNRAVPLVKKELPAAENKLRKAADFVRHDLSYVEDQIHHMASLISTGTPQVEEGVHRLADIVRNDFPQMGESVRKAADKIRKIKKATDLEDISKLLGGDIKAKSEFLANPVKLVDERLYPIPNYGSAMTPFYVVLALWVGGTLLISLLRVNVDTEGKTYKGYQLYFGRLLTFLTIGICQALAASLGNILILPTYIVNKVWFVLFAVLISIVFVTIVFTLVSVFGNIGKGVAIVFMVLQFSSSGGTFPISTTGHFFQMLNPFMPFTYAISLMREAVGGILPEVAIKDVLSLLSFIGVCLLLALLLKKPLSKSISRTAEKTKSTKLLS
ncbi:YhgE/Pip family protein [Paenibacillus sp. GCM10012307]|uniref:YhgE/Pip domain-containing protein n=1 Tax=Paenibacillus roseus TaxID=2798579 RepID=A0A934J6U8_9BACL|nr:YhgE/Pip domain-containing protein [Paenibacillus roseus]MBJ6362703.1 YhgE/Pip domain-containing protein [Paenibacillus roseus]